MRGLAPILIGPTESAEASGKVYNAGSADEIGIRDLAEQVKVVAGSASAVAAGAGLE